MKPTTDLDVICWMCENLIHQGGNSSIVTVATNWLKASNYSHLIAQDLGYSEMAKILKGNNYAAF